MFFGPPRQGKSTTLRRVMKEIIDLKSAGETEKIHGSTGTVECCPNMLVKNISDPERGANWTIVQNLTDEACIIFHRLKDSREELKSVPQAAACLSDVEETVTEGAQRGVLQRIVKKIKSSFKSKQSQSENSPLPPSPVLDTQDLDQLNLPDYSEIAALFKEASQQPNFAEEMKSFKAYLRIEDTGGQPEMMDMLPALTIGPGLYLVFFSYEFKLDEQYKVFYQRDSGKKTALKKSEFTLQEMLLCTLASISCSTATRTSQSERVAESSEMNQILESSKSVVFIVGTHKDKVSAEEITRVDMQLKKIIEDTDFYKDGIVQFCSEDKPVVSLDNMEGGSEEIDQLHQLLEKAMEKHFRKLKIPAVWLLFSLCLRMRGVRTASMETCMELARALNMTPYETKTALWFLHHHAGLIMYFPGVSGLEDLVIIDVQVVYDSITAVILQSMSFDNVGQVPAERFKKTGQFTMRDIALATAGISEDIVPPLKLVALLEYLHIIAQIVPVDTSHIDSGKENDVYIMPCVLENTSHQELDLFHKEACRASLALPLSVYFTCGFTPMGLFPAMIACFISNKSFTLIKESIKKNMVQFLFDAKLQVTFICRPKYFEVAVDCNPSIHGCLHQECTSLKEAIENTLGEASSRMNYSSYMNYQFGFECSSHEGGNHLGVLKISDSSPRTMVCLYNPNYPQIVDLHKKHLVWFGQVRYCIYS